MVNLLDKDDQQFSHRVQRMSEFNDFISWEMNRYGNTKFSSLLVYPLNNKINEIIGGE